MGIKCSVCGGETKFNTYTQKLECAYCGASFEPNIEEDVYTAERAETWGNTNNQEDGIETTTYKCNECGAEVKTFLEEATIMCPYCGKQTFMKERGTTKRPKKMIPFQMEEEEIKNHYQRFIKKYSFVPKEYLKEDMLEKFKGIYIPYWDLSYKTDGDYIFEYRDSYSKGSYNYVDTYEVSATMEGQLSGITIDASKAFDDRIAGAIAPFDADKATEFNEAYCSGYFVDQENVYLDEVEETGKQLAEEEITKGLHRQPVPQKSRTAYLEKTLQKPNLEKTSEDIMLLPVWFFTHRNKDRVSYMVANGQTGKMTADVPVDIKKCLTSMAIRAIIFAVIFLWLFSTILHGITAPVTTIATMIMGLLGYTLLWREENAIYKRDNNTPTAQNAEKSKKRSKIIGTLLVIGFFCIIPNIKLLLAGINSGVTRATPIHVIIAIALLVILILLSKKRGLVISNKDKKWAFPLFLSFIVTIIIFLFSPAIDSFYYIASILNVIATLICCLKCINNFNNLTSRPVPNFYERGDIL